MRHAGEWRDATDVTPLEQRSDAPLELHFDRAPPAKPAPRPAASAPAATLLVGGPDRPGVVGSLTRVLEGRGAKILASDQHADRGERVFFQRIRFELPPAANERTVLETEVRAVCERYEMDYRLYGDRRRRVAILASKQDHCLYDLLVRWRAGELACEVVMIVSNHTGAAAIARHFQVPFHHLPVTADTKPAQEARMLELLEAAGVELVVLARYMQILSPAVVDRYPTRIINIHHSFLPAFVGANPYRQAHDKGVKLIGATSHYVTADLDQGPIIEQETVRCSHRDTLEDLVRKGRDLEKRVLAAAVRCHLEDRIMVYAGRTVVFD